MQLWCDLALYRSLITDQWTSSFLLISILITLELKIVLLFYRTNDVYIDLTARGRKREKHEIGLYWLFEIETSSSMNRHSILSSVTPLTAICSWWKKECCFKLLAWGYPLFFMKIFLKTFLLFMGSEGRLGVDISISLSMSLIGPTVKFLSIIRGICFSENCQNFSSVEIFLNMLIWFAIRNCRLNP